MQDKKLTVEDIEVPREMQIAATSAVEALWNKMPNAWNPSQSKASIAGAAVYAALLWITENPIVPIDADSSEMYQYATEHRAGSLLQHRYMLMEWQRRMFLRKPEPVPEEVGRKLSEHGFVASVDGKLTTIGKAAIEIFRLGKEARDGN